MSPENCVIACITLLLVGKKKRTSLGIEKDRKLRCTENRPEDAGIKYEKRVTM